ncbi:hypothetical protein E4U48_002644 [Claviceps purpurea]|nr:hypothetical protein E4U48_002644 [Claviceps purpurea]
MDEWNANIIPYDDEESYDEEFDDEGFDDEGFDDEGFDDEEFDDDELIPSAGEESISSDNEE